MQTWLGESLRAADPPPAHTVASPNAHGSLYGVTKQSLPPAALCAIQRSNPVLTQRARGEDANLASLDTA